MAKIKKRIGLSLGADLCWPVCYEEILKTLDLKLPIGGDEISFEVERVLIQPFALNKDKQYDLVMDRLAHWYRTSREWVKKIIVMDETYVLNNPWTFQSMEKQTSYCALKHLGFPVPETWLIPPKESADNVDLERTLQSYAKLFDLGEIGAEIGYPMYMKPYDGGAWKGVSRIDNADHLNEAYDNSGELIMHLQKAVDPHDIFVRALGVGPQVRPMKYDPSAPLHDRYVVAKDPITGADADHMRTMTLVINAFFGWDFNSCEALLQKGTWYPIDFANACPDSQVTSLHYHFPWLLGALIRWSTFCTATGRPMRLNPDWAPFYKVARERDSFADRMEGYSEIVEAHFDTQRFEEFCDAHLGNLDEVIDEFFTTDKAKDAVRQKVHALYPENEWEEFTDLFWGRIQKWRSDQGSVTT